VNSNSYNNLLTTIKKLRDPNGGCPWDLKQTLKTLGPSLLEECCECLDGISNDDSENIAEELGDVMFTATLMGYILEQEKITTTDSILDHVNSKMVRRHPHVFKTDSESISTSDEVLVQWEKIKKEKEGRVTKTILSNIPSSIPPLAKSNEIQKKVAKNGFDWDSVDGIFDKIVEETEEVKVEIESQDRDKLELELGDLLFSVVNLARYLKIDPSIALSRKKIW